MFSNLSKVKHASTCDLLKISILFAYILNYSHVFFFNVNFELVCVCVQLQNAVSHQTRGYNETRAERSDGSEKTESGG